MPDLEITSSKNLFMLYALLDTYGYNGDKFNIHELRRVSRGIFRHYQGDLKPDEFGHYTTTVNYVLTLDDKLNTIPNLHLDKLARDRVDQGKVIHPHLLHFRETAFFNPIYKLVLRPSYDSVVEQVANILNLFSSTTNSCLGLSLIKLSNNP